MSKKKKLKGGKVFIDHDQSKEERGIQKQI